MATVVLVLGGTAGVAAADDDDDDDYWARSSCYWSCSDDHSSRSTWSWGGWSSYAEGGTSAASSSEAASSVEESGTVGAVEMGSGSMYKVVDQIGARALWEQGITGEGIDVAVIDTGVAPVPALTGADKVVAMVDLSFEAGIPEAVYLDTHGHGTHMAGIIAGSAPEAPGASIERLRVPGSRVGVEQLAGRVSETLLRGSGTSQAAAVVSGAAALLLDDRPELTPDQVKALLMTSADKLPRTVTTLQGSGLIDLPAAIDLPVPSTTQKWPRSTGTGSLEAARGTNHVVIDGVAITGERTAFGDAWNPSMWIDLAASGATWTDGALTGSSWTGSSWTGSSWSGSSWTGSSWSGSSWTGSSWTGLSWTGSSWTGLSWTGSSWTGSSWTGSSWSGSSWTDHGWLGVSWF